MAMSVEWERRLESEQGAVLGREVWYHGHLPRENLHLVLFHDGEFLIRFNNKKRSHGFVLSVLWDGELAHFKIHIDDSVFFTRSDERFSGIRELVLHYLNSSSPLVPGELSNVRLKSPAPRHRWEIRRQHVIQQRKIGNGRYGEVWFGSYTRGGTSKKKQDGILQYYPLDVVIKTYKDVNLVCEGPDGRAVFEQEAMHLLRLNNKNLVRTVGINLSGDPMMILTEYMSKGNLRSYLRANKDKIPGSRQRQMCTDIAKGLFYLADLNCVHYDVAARNCLVDTHDHVKICPPSIQKGQKKFKVLMEKVSIKWMAPETMRKGVFTSESDVWSFGVLIWEVLSYGAEPWPGLGSDDVRRRILIDHARLPTPRNAAPALAIQMYSCWKTDPESRPSFAQILLSIHPIDTTDKTDTETKRPSK